MPATARVRRDLGRLALLSLALVAFDALHVATNPPVDADAYEYAGVARSLARTGHLTETHLRGYHFADPQPMELPHPGAHRANLQAWLLVPSYLLFGEDWKTIAVPHLAVMLLLPLALYLGALKPFGRRVAYATAWLVPLLPRVAYFAGFEDPGQPDWLRWVLLSLVPSALLGRRWVRAGLLCGVATLLKSDGVVWIAAWLGWAVVFDRATLRDRRAWLFPVMALLVLAPYGVRNWRVFGTPIHSEDVGRWLVEPPEKVISLQHMLEPLAGGPFRPDDAPDTAVHPPFPTTVRVLLAGRYSDNGFYPGLPELLGWLLVPFAFVGLAAVRRSRRRMLPVAHAALHVAMFVVVLLAEDRYLFPALAPIVSLAWIGLDRVHRRVRRLSPRRVVAFVLLTDAATMALRGAVEIKDAEERGPYEELVTIGRVLQHETAPGDVLMTLPFWSPHFLFDRPTVPFPWGDLATIRRIAAHYRARALILDHRFLPDLVPELPGTISTAEGHSLSLRMLDPDRVAIDGSSPPNPLGHLNPLATFHEHRVRFSVYPSLPYALSRLPGGWFVALPLYLLLAVAFVWPALRPSRRLMLGLLLVLLSHGVKLFALVQAWGMSRPEERPRVCWEEVRMAVARLASSPSGSPARITAADLDHDAKPAGFEPRNVSIDGTCVTAYLPEDLTVALNDDRAVDEARRRFAAAMQTAERLSGEWSDRGARSTRTGVAVIVTEPVADREGVCEPAPRSEPGSAS